jgi:4-amino-4-deoxy-L-arabinose transferase-like glycosyltransferase
VKALDNRLAVPRRSSYDRFGWATWGAPLALALVAFLLRVPHLDAQSLWRDEVDVLRFANQPAAELLHNLAQIKYNGPLYYIIMRGWLALAGESEFALRFLAACAGVLAVSLTGWIGQALIGRRAAWLAALLVAVSPYMVWYSQEAKMYALVSALTLLAMACQLRALTTGRAGWWAGFVVAASLSFYIHMLAALLIPVYAMVFLLAWPGYRRRWRGWLASMGVLTLPYVPLVLWQLPLVVNTYATGHPFYSIQDVLASLFNLYTRGVALVGNWVVVAAFLFAALGGIFTPPGLRPAQKRAGGRNLNVDFNFRPGLEAPLLSPPRQNVQGRTGVKNLEVGFNFSGESSPQWGELEEGEPAGCLSRWRLKRRLAFLPPSISPAGGEARWSPASILNATRLRLFLLIWLFLPIGVVYLVSLRAPVFEPRYMIFVAPAFYLLAGLGLTVLWQSWRPAAGVAMAVILSFSLLGVWTQATVPLKSDFRAAAAYVAAHRHDSAPIMFHMPYVRYTFDYYFHGEYTALEGPWTNDGQTEAQVDAAMTRLLAGYGDVWVVFSESWLWDSRGLVRSWLDRHARLVETAHFALVDVCHYDLDTNDSSHRQGAEFAELSFDPPSNPPR